MKVGDKITIRNQVLLNRKISEFPKLEIKLGNEYEISKIWRNAIPETLYGLDVNPNIGFTEDDLKMIQLPLHIDPHPRFIKTFESFRG
jgi:hypothetical protein